MKWFVCWLMSAAVLAQDYYLATFRNGARDPPRPMTLVLRDASSTNVTLQPGDGIERRARRGLAVDWFDGNVQLNTVNWRFKRSGMSFRPPPGCGIAPKYCISARFVKSPGLSRL